MHKSKGNAIGFEEAAEKMGADVMRWMFCARNPATNLNFGYGPATRSSAASSCTLWNTYAFFVTYARLDGWTPAGDGAGVERDLHRARPLDAVAS